MTSQSTCTTCPYCGTGCGVLATPNGAGGLTVTGDPEHPANFGRLCSKGSALGETVSTDHRLLAPQIGDSSASWDEALSLVAEKFRIAADDHGPDSVAFYVSGQLLTEDYYVANKLMKGYIGSGNIDTNSRLCMASTVAGHKRAFGTDTVPGAYEDLELADLVILTGSNLAWCHPVLYQRIAAAKAARPTMQVVVIDPRRTATCDLSDMHLAIQPGTDVALFNHLLTQSHAKGATDLTFISQSLSGFAEALDTANKTDVAVTGLNQEQLSEFSNLWVSTEKSVTVFSQGVNQSDHGADKVNAIINCHLATGRIGKPGCGPFSVTGQPNAMGGREVGGLANTLACHLDIENPVHRVSVQSFWNAPTIAESQGLKAVDMFEAVGTGKIKALWVMGTNPAVSMPNASKVRAAMSNCDFVVVSDMFGTTDTARLADVVLPATGWGEKEGTVTNSDRTISRQRAILPVPSDARHDWQIICDVAKYMGFTEGFRFSSPLDIFREHAALSGLAAKLGKDFDISGLAQISDVEYQSMKPVKWPVSSRGKTPNQRFFSDGQFFTPDRRAKMIPVRQPHLPQMLEPPQFRLNTGRIRDQWHTMSRTGQSPRLNQHYGEPFLEIHPSDAIQLGLVEADLVKVSNPFGSVVLRALVTDRISQGQVFAPIHWTGETAANSVVSDLVAPDVDPVSGQPDSKSAYVSLSKFDAVWYGYAVGVEQPHATTNYWAKAKLVDGWQLELADVSTPESWEGFARTLLQTGKAQCSSLIDTHKGRVRMAFHSGEQLVGALFVDQAPVQVSRNFAGMTLHQSGLDVLAGRPRTTQLDPGPTVCACFNVGVNTILAAIEDNNLVSVEQIATTLSAGSNCGSCRPELAALLSEARRQLAAE
ncbi:nitrate reductase [Shimia sagamensis]|uniref:Assimilatory nitrate reductase catalytic subunit n=1 Tax=Shimia sagamensis TaxID=1566352 RepID=A0ABY1NU05_9RHOB|nr:nitrate reductase [Shimia sagamensis]SMP17911.1 assimilatory nitrate reductase catalytic subunit [Shimia sagamensis]